MSECRWVVHRSVRILVVDYGGATTEAAMMAVLNREVELIRAEGRPVRVVSDYRNAFLSEGFVERAKRLSKENRARVIERSAVVGLTGIRKVLLQTYRLFADDHATRAFDTLEAAFDWLSSDANPSA